MPDHELAIGDRVCFEGNVAAKYGTVDDLSFRDVHIVWEDGGKPQWIAKQRVFFCPDAAELERLKRAFKPWSD